MTDGQPFEQRFEVRWSDLDPNRHLRNTVFSEYATHARFSLLASHGFPQTKFESLRFGPVMFREEIRYRREVVFGDAVRVNVLFSGLADDGSHWKVVQEVTGSDGRRAAVVTVEGAWIHLDSRKLIAPPPELLAVLQQLPRTPDFRELRSLARG